MKRIIRQITLEFGSADKNLDRYRALKGAEICTRKSNEQKALSGGLSDIYIYIYIDSRCFNGLQIRIGVDY